VLKPQLQQAYTRDQVLRVSGVSERQVRIWERAGLIPRRDDYAIADLKSLQTLEKLRLAGLGPKRIAQVFTTIQDKLNGITDPLTEVTVLIENKDVHVLVDGQRMQASSGQLLFNFDRQEISRLLSFPKERKEETEQASVQKRVADAADWFQRGLDVEQTGVNLDRAVAAYERAIELDPNCVGALVNLGTIHFHARQWKKAETHYKRALEAEPEYALGHFNLGNLFDERGEVALAFEHYAVALRIAPNYADAHYNLALLCQRVGQTMRAVRHWRAYLKLDPSSNWAEIARRELAKLRDATVVRGENPNDGQRSPRVVS
jgi:tetratricopeptide (TPR) repeat protein